VDDFDLPLTLIVAFLVPTLLGAVVGFPLWRSRKAMLGNILASIMVGIVIIFLIMQTFAMFFACSSAQIEACGSQAMMDYATRVLLGLAVIGWLDVFVLLFLSGIVEDRSRKRSLRLEDL
jgi:hypothetical protein